MDWSCLKEVYKSRTSGAALFNLEAEGVSLRAHNNPTNAVLELPPHTAVGQYSKNDELRVFDRAKSRANMSAGVPEAAPFGQE